MLRKQRIAAGLTAAELARAIGMSASKVSRFESGESGIYLDDLEKLLDFYRLSKKRRVELMDIARHAEERGWLRIRNANLPADSQAWTDFEDEASGILDYEPFGLPGLLQTPEYARTIIEATGGELLDGEVDALVANRTVRQGLLTRKDPVRLHAIIEESVLARRFGEDGAWERQIRHLIDSTSRPNVTLQVLGSDVGLHPGLNGPFIVLVYDAEPSLVWLENRISSLVLDEDEQIDVFTGIWDELAKLAMTPARSVERLGELLD
ncbi:helix-turn-helix transcriptional regulator [Saccharopolyspora shandongensis]|uniref:helix-turn-helix domain-containing protein n=1 Tax=Saccharopolyspora shandongensis TaxID=418495 RepID=UPI003441B899